MLTMGHSEQFVEFYYNQFDQDRKQLAALYVSLNHLVERGVAKNLLARQLDADLRV